jgi:hypothetical protein
MGALATELRRSVQRVSRTGALILPKIGSHPGSPRPARRERLDRSSPSAMMFDLIFPSDGLIVNLNILFFCMAETFDAP